MWKKMGKGEEAQANKVGLVTLLDIEWKELDHDSKNVQKFYQNINSLSFGISYGKVFKYMFQEDFGVTKKKKQKPIRSKKITKQEL